MSLVVKPEYEKLLPRMSEEEFEALKASIQEEGQHFPIIANENLEVLDGHHRHKACLELGIEPDFEIRRFEDKLLEKKFVIEANIRRRHLTSFQLVELGLPLLEIERELAKKRKMEGGKKGRDLQLGIASNDAKPVSDGKASEKVAKKIGLSTRTFERGKKIAERASEEDKQRLREGKASISGVYREMFSSEGDPTQNPSAGEIGHEFTPLEYGSFGPPPPEESVQSQANRENLERILEELREMNLTCPHCKTQLRIECSHCHTNLSKS